MKIKKLYERNSNPPLFGWNRAKIKGAIKYIYDWGVANRQALKGGLGGWEQVGDMLYETPYDVDDLFDVVAENPEARRILDEIKDGVEELGLRFA